MRLDPFDPPTEAIESIAKVVREGGVIVYPTDTIYGLGCSPWNSMAVERIFAIKRRPERKGLLVLIPETSWLPDLCSGIPLGFESLAQDLWPGPVTFLLPASSRLPLLVRGDGNLVGVRNPDSAFLQLLMRAIPGPLVSTSANISGLAVPGSVDELEGLLSHRVDLFINGGEPPASGPSTVVDLSVSPPDIVREGEMKARVRQRLAETFGGWQASARMPGKSQ